MLNELFDESHSKYRSLSLLGPILDDFDDWLAIHGYAFSTRQNYIMDCAHIERYLEKRGVRTSTGISAELIGRCWRYFKVRPGHKEHAVGRLQTFLEEHQLLTRASQPLSMIDDLVNGYQRYLADVRGFSAGTIREHCGSALEFLQSTRRRDSRDQLDLDVLSRNYIERFVTRISGRLGRGRLQHVVAHIRSLLRYLAMLGKVPTGLDLQIDTPRAYRQEQLPKSLPWDVVCAFLNSIDRSDARGLRAYTIFLLMATYGLRASDVAGLRLQDIDWRAGEIHIRPRKTKHPLILPLFDHVGKALIAYLRKGRPHSKCREVFLTLQAPITPVTIHSIGHAFRSRVRSGKLPIPFEGVHCLRHSYAVHLLQEGASFKAIGDVLGHHSTESTCVYLRLNIEELRDAALPLPASCKKEADK